MFRLKLKFLFLVVLLAPLLAMAQTQNELYLSYEQRVALSYVLLGQGESFQNQEEIFQRARSYFQKVAQTPVQEVPVANFAEFLKHFRGEWPNTNSLKYDLELIEKRGPHAMTLYKASSARIQKQIDTYLESQLIKLAEIAGLQTLSTEKLLPLLDTSALAQKTLKAWFLGLGDTLMSEQLAEINKVGEKIASSGFAQQQDAQMRILMQTLFSEYFSRLSADSKKMIISTAMGSDLLIPDIKKFEIMVQNSGPQLQKLLQVVARQSGIDSAMQEIFKTLENSVRPVPWVQVAEILKVNEKAHKFTFFERKPLGVGTMAQVHRAKLQLDGIRHDVVVRFIKPGIAERVQEDKKILSDVAQILDSNQAFRDTGTPKLAPIVDDITKTVLDELSQKDTVERQKLARSRYQQSSFIDTPEYKNLLLFNVPKIYDSSIASDLLVQEMVIGNKLDKEIKIYKDSAPGLKKAVIEEMARLWAQEVLFKGGFYHSDLHQGNFMMQITDPAVKLHILDFGMGGMITHQMQGQVMLLGAGVELNKTELIARAFWSLHEKSESSLQEKDFNSLVEKKVQEVLRTDGKMSLEKWTVWAMDQGVHLPYEFISLNRGIAIINKLLADSGSALNLGQLMKILAMQNPLQVYKRLILEQKVSHKDLLRLGWAEMKTFILPMQTEPLKTLQIRCESVFI